MNSPLDNISPAPIDMNHIEILVRAATSANTTAKKIATNIDGIISSLLPLTSARLYAVRYALEIYCKTLQILLNNITSLTDKIEVAKVNDATLTRTILSATELVSIALNASLKKYQSISFIPASYINMDIIRDIPKSIDESNKILQAIFFIQREACRVNSYSTINAVRIMFGNLST
jgi:hypothetical protein